MTGRLASNIVICFLAIAILAGGWYGLGQVASLRDDQREIVATLVQRPRAARVLENSYTGDDGQTWIVRVESEPGESTASLAMRFEAELSTMKRSHPARR